MQCNGLKPFWGELYDETARSIWLPRKEQRNMDEMALKVPGTYLGSTNVQILIIFMKYMLDKLIVRCLGRCTQAKCQFDNDNF